MLIRLTSEDLIQGNATEVLSFALKYLVRIPAVRDGNEWGEYKFWNHKDSKLQSVVADGTKFIIINQPTVVDARHIELFERMADIDGLSGLEKPRRVLDWVEKYLGYQDRYDSNVTYENKSLEAAKIAGENLLPKNLKQRKALPCLAVYCPHPTQLTLKTGEPQMATTNCVLVHDGDELRMVQTSIFVETYRLPDGSPIEVSQLPVYEGA